MQSQDNPKQEYRRAPTRLGNWHIIDSTLREGEQFARGNFSLSHLMTRLKLLKH